MAIFELIFSGSNVSQSQNEQDGNKQLNLKFKNTVVIGVHLNENDYIREIDLNELS